MVSRPALLPFQPRPSAVQVAHLPVGGRVVTAISRAWAAGDEDRCRLCDECTAHDGMCMVVVARDVPYGECVLFSTAGLAGRAEGPRLAVIG